MERLRPIDHVGSLGAPVLILSGTLDQHTTIDEARAIFAAAQPPECVSRLDGLRLCRSGGMGDLVRGTGIEPVAPAV